MNSLEDDQVIPPLILYSSRLPAVAFTTILPALTVQVGCVTAGLLIVILPFTNTVAVTGVPIQPLAVAVMVKLTVTSVPVVLVNVPLILPVPFAGIPVTVPLARSPLSLVQL